MKVLEKKKRKTEEKNGKHTRERVRWYYLVECEKCGSQKWIREGSSTLKKEIYLCQSCFFKKEYFCKECGIKLPEKGEYCEDHKRSFCRKCGKQIPYRKHYCDNCKAPIRKSDQRMKDSRECEYCGEMFFPFYNGSRQYCSRDCSHLANKSLTPEEENQRAICRKETKVYQRAGHLKPEKCVICGSTENLHTHHYDYSKPNSVYILCQTHHHKVHRLNTNLSGLEKTECEWGAAEITKELKHKGTLTYKNELLKKKRVELDKDLTALVKSLFGTPTSFREVVSKGTKIEAMIGARHKSIKLFRKNWCKERKICPRCGNLIKECFCQWHLRDK